MKVDARQLQEAEWQLAHQFGQLFVSELNPQKVLDDFTRVFKGDSQAFEHFDNGVAQENQKRLALGLSVAEYRYHHLQQAQLPPKRRSNGRLQSRKPAKAN